jgi:hypothetical protein
LHINEIATLYFELDKIKLNFELYEVKKTENNYLLQNSDLKAAAGNEMGNSFGLACCALFNKRRRSALNATFFF